MIHTEVLKFHEKLRAAKSLDEVIQLHDEQYVLYFVLLFILVNCIGTSSINRVLAQCFLDVNTSNLRKAIVSTLDMCLHFANFFVAFAGETTTTHNVSKSMKRHRSRRLKRLRRNTIGFTQVRKHADSSSSSDDGDELELDERGRVPEASFSTSISISDINPVEHLDKLSKELDELVRFVRRGVEGLANAADNAASTFGILAFALEDWDL